VNYLLGYLAIGVFLYPAFVYHDVLNYNREERSIAKIYVILGYVFAILLWPYLLFRKD
jgi:hypothetical protein